MKNGDLREGRNKGTVHLMLKIHMHTNCMYFICTQKAWAGMTLFILSSLYTVEHLIVRFDT